MSEHTTCLLALLVLAIVIISLFVLCVVSDSGHGSRTVDFDEAIKRIRNAQSPEELVLILFYYGRLFFRMGQWGYAAVAAGALATMGVGMCGNGWEIGRRILCDVLRSLENLILGKSTSCGAESASTLDRW